MPSPRTCTASQQQYNQHYSLKYNQRYMLPQLQPQEKHRGTSAGSCKSSIGGVLLVQAPPAVSAAAAAQKQQRSSGSDAATVVEHHYGLRHETQQTGLFKTAAATTAAGTSMKRNNASTDNFPATLTAAIVARSSNSSASVGAVASGSWVATWVSFPMLLPVERDTPITTHPKQQHNQQKQQQRNDAVADTSSPWLSSSPYKVHQKRQSSTARRTDVARRSTTATKKPTAMPFPRAAAPAPAPYVYNTAWSFKAPAAAQGGRNARPGTESAAFTRRAAAAAAAASSHRSWVARVNRKSAALLQLAQTVMQIVNTARSRSLQCVIPAATDDSVGSASPNMNSSKGGSGGFGSSAFAANNAACIASKQLFSAALALEKASWLAVHTAAASASATQQQQLQQLCAAVGLAHRELQTKLAAAVFKQSQPAQTPTAAALFSTAATPFPPAAYNSKQQKKAAKAAAPSAIPLGPVGGVELLRSTKRSHQIHSTSAPLGPFGTSRSFVKSIAAPGALQGPLLPLTQQLAAHTRNIVSSTAYAPAHPTGVVNAHGAARYSSSSSVWMLNLGWDQRSAWAAAKAAAELSKAEANLQRACQHVLVAAAAA
jgi:hypothetical protein